MTNVLDHGFVNLVDSMGNDLSIVRNARVSYNAEWRAGDNEGSDSKLLNYLYNNGHNTPFEAVTFTFDIKAPIFVFRQWHRHRTQSYNELSARYKELPEEFYIPEPHLLGKQNADNKQMRDTMTPEEFEALPGSEREVIIGLLNIMRSHNETSFAQYRLLIECGTPRELARSVLPFATYSHMFATMNLHNLLNFIRERIHPHAQYEIQVYAKAMLELIRPIVPVTVDIFEKGLKNV